MICLENNGFCPHYFDTVSACYFLNRRYKTIHAEFLFTISVRYTYTNKRLNNTIVLKFITAQLNLSENRHSRRGTQVRWRHSHLVAVSTRTPLRTPGCIVRRGFRRASQRQLRRWWRRLRKSRAWTPSNVARCWIRCRLVCSACWRSKATWRSIKRQTPDTSDNIWLECDAVNGDFLTKLTVRWWVFECWWCWDFFYMSDWNGEKCRMVCLTASDLEVICTHCIKIMQTKVIISRQIKPLAYTMRWKHPKQSLLVQKQQNLPRTKKRDQNGPG